MVSFSHSQYLFVDRIRTMWPSSFSRQTIYRQITDKYIVVILPLDYRTPSWLIRQFCYVTNLIHQDALDL